MAFTLKIIAATAWRAVLRPILAYSAASLAAGLTFILAGLSRARTPVDPGTFADMAWVVAFIVAAIASIALVPTAVALIVVRVGNCRRGVADALAGAIIGAYWGLWAKAGLTPGPGYAWLALFTLAGLTGGVTYWLINGRPRSRNLR